MQKSLNEFEFRPDSTTDYAELAERLKIDVTPFLSVAFDPILSNLTRNEDIHVILDEFKFRSDRTIDYGVSCP